MILKRELFLAIHRLGDRAEADDGKNGHWRQGRDEEDEKGLTTQGRQRSLKEAQNCSSTHAHTLPAASVSDGRGEKMRRRRGSPRLCSRHAATSDDRTDHVQGGHFLGSRYTPLFKRGVWSVDLGAVKPHPPTVGDCTTWSVQLSECAHHRQTCAASIRAAQSEAADVLPTPTPPQGASMSASLMPRVCPHFTALPSPFALAASGSG